EIRAGGRDRQMQIMGKGGDAAAAREMIADERHAFEGLHFIVSQRSFVGATCARARLVARLFDGLPVSTCLKCRSRYWTGPTPVWGTSGTMPLLPTRNSTRSDSAKIVSAAATSKESARPPPLKTSSQVSRFVSRYQVEFGARSILSSAKCRPETRSVRSSVSRL